MKGHENLWTSTHLLRHTVQNNPVDFVQNNPVDIKSTDHVFLPPPWLWGASFQEPDIVQLLVPLQASQLQSNVH